MRHLEIRFIRGHLGSLQSATGYGNVIVGLMGGVEHINTDTVLSKVAIRSNACATFRTNAIELIAGDSRAFAKVRDAINSKGITMD